MDGDTVKKKGLKKKKPAKTQSPVEDSLYYEGDI